MYFPFIHLFCYSNLYHICHVWFTILSICQKYSISWKFVYFPFIYLFCLAAVTFTGLHISSFLLAAVVHKEHKPICVPSCYLRALKVRKSLHWGKTDKNIKQFLNFRYISFKLIFVFVFLFISYLFEEKRWHNSFYLQLKLIFIFVFVC